jgi:hypothetical protein
MNSSLSPERKSEIMLQNITRSDCGVIACQYLTGLPRQRAYELCVSIGHYEEGLGIERGRLNLVLQQIGYKLTLMPTSHNETVATFALNHEYGSFLIYTKDHVSAMVEGDLRNAKGDWHAPIEEAYKVEAAE